MGRLTDVAAPGSTLARVAETALVALVAVVLLVAVATLGALRRGRGGLRRLAVPVQHEAFRRRDERGAMSLVELVVTTVIASVLLAAIGTVAAVAERSAAMTSSSYGAARRADTALASAMSAISDASPVHGCVLTSSGTPESGPTAVYGIGFSNCAQSEATTPAVAAAYRFPHAANGEARGLCWFSYPGGGAGLVPPDLRCLVLYADHTLWAFDWPPLQGISYTQCNPSSCFGASAPYIFQCNPSSCSSSNTGAPVALPPEPSSSAPYSGIATFAGKTSISPECSPTTQPARCPFVFTDKTGQLITNPSTNLPGIYGVQVNVREDYGTLGPTKEFSSSSSYQAYVGSAAQGGKQSWQSI